MARRAFRPEQLAAIRAYYETVQPFCLTNGKRLALRDDSLVNRDLAPRDEYFLNNGDAPAAARCG